MDESCTNFIMDIIEDDLREGRVSKVHTRFPPEPNGYLHIGSAKAIYINYVAAKKFGGLFNLRFDDTNPVKEETEFVDAIEKDLEWLLGEKPSGGIFYGSDYFQSCYEFAVLLIKKGLAYVCDLSQEEMRSYRGTLTEPGIDSPYRNRTIEENLDLFERMKNGEFEDGSRVLRAKIDMSSPNMNMRDPAIYRILHANHHRQGDKWCIYPLYDYAHPIQDALEGITHSCCSIEFENHRPLYDWVVNSIDFCEKPHQYEFARLNVSYTVMSKRYLRELVETKYVDGWDDPRLPTLCALRRRGYTPSSILEFVTRAGVSKTYSLVDAGLLEYCIRNELNESAPRRVAILDPVKVVLTNYPENKTEYIELPNHPQKPELGTRQVSFSRELYIERSDFEESPPPKFFRLKPGGEVRLMGCYYITAHEVIKDESGRITELRCTYDPQTRTGSSPDGRKVKGTIHWLDAGTAEDITARIYDRLFTLEDLNSLPEDKSFGDYLNPDSLKVQGGAKAEPALLKAAAGEKFQFVRNGYFCKDSKYENSFNLIVGLKDGYSK